MAKTFMQMVQEAKAEVPGVSPVEAQRSFQEDPDALLLEVRDAGNIPVDEKAPNAVNISLGTLPIRADLEVPEERRDPLHTLRSTRLFKRTFPNKSAITRRINRTSAIGFVTVVHIVRLFIKP